MKIVLNGYYGGFGLSYEAQTLYLRATGKEAFFYVDMSTYNNYTKVHQYKRINISEVKETYRMLYCTTTDQGEYLFDFPEDIVYFDNIDRTDPVLVSVVETMGSKAASGRYASLYIEELADGVMYKIDNYDGLESLITQEDDDWLIAQSNPCQDDIEQNIKNLWATMKPESIPDPDLAFTEENTNAT